MNKFKVISDFTPQGDQPKAIQNLKNGVTNGLDYQTLMGITGSGKSATIAWLIEELQMPSLVLAPNKALAAQLANEFKQFFPENRVEYFVSYYDYYQPEAYVPRTDTFIEKDSNINEEIDRLRHSATSALLLRKDVIVVSSVSCIYGLGSPQEYKNKIIPLFKGEEFELDQLLEELIRQQYVRNDLVVTRGTFRLKGDTLDIFPVYEETIFRVEYFGDTIENILRIDPVTGEIWTNEHGPRGGDEINIIKKGKNYGWPKITYGINYSLTTITKDKSLPGMEQPLYYWLPSIAPSSFEYISSNIYPNWNGSLLAGALVFKHIERIGLKNNKVVSRSKIAEGLGRPRDIKQGPDGYIYVSIENKGIYKIIPKE